jgi:hypothetical protein
MRLLRSVVAVAFVAVAFGLLAESGSAMTTFSGTCSYSGFSRFWPGRKFVSVSSGYHYQGKGTCDGKLNGSPFKGKSNIDVNADMHQPMGCLVGGSTYGGPVIMTFLTKRQKGEKRHKKPVLVAWTDEVNVGPSIATDLWGTYRGFAYGTGTLHADPNKSFPQCAGKGVPGLILSTTYTTVTELRG